MRRTTLQPLTLVFVIALLSIGFGQQTPQEEPPESPDRQHGISIEEASEGSGWENGDQVLFEFYDFDGITGTPEGPKTYRYKRCVIPVDVEGYEDVELGEAWITEYPDGTFHVSWGDGEDSLVWELNGECTLNYGGYQATGNAF